MKCGGAGDCSWEGTFSEAESHVATCKYAFLPCPKKCKDGDNIRLIKRNDLDEHLELCPNREFTCPDCGEEDTFVSITESHAEVCKKKKVPCPNVDCTKSLQRQNMKRHLDH